jgi:hypothetical protein
MPLFFPEKPRVYLELQILRFQKQPRPQVTTGPGHLVGMPSALITTKQMMQGKSVKQPFSTASTCPATKPD